MLVPCLCSLESLITITEKKLASLRCVGPCGIKMGIDIDFFKLDSYLGLKFWCNDVKKKLLDSRMLPQISVIHPDMNRD